MNTKEKIMHIALDLFSVRGFSAVSVHEIAKEVGIKAPSLYKHYKSKQDIFDTIVKKYSENANKFLENIYLLNKFIDLEINDVFDEKFFLELSYYFETRMGVHLEYEQDNVKVLDGRFDRPDTIVLVFPKNLVYRNKITDKDFMNVLFQNECIELILLFGEMINEPGQKSRT